MNMIIPAIKPQDEENAVFSVIDETDLDPAMWDIVYDDARQLYVFTQKETGRVVTDKMSAWKAMLKQEAPDA